MCYLFASFIEPFPFKQSTTSRRHLRVARCNINRTSDPAREDEIAAKVANLRKQKRLKSQNPSPAHDDMNRSESQRPTESYVPSSQFSFEDLPDWKKEKVLESQIAAAEKFFYPNANGSEHFSESKTDPPEELGDYQPKVSTWGVFPRPDNISKSYGGGRRIRTGGVELDNNEIRKRDEEVRKRLAAYRASRGVDMEKEEAHRDEIETALRDYEKLMKRTLPYDAVEKLEKVEGFTSDRSRLGGKVLLSLALAYEAVGRRQDAREIYVRLRQNPFSEISSKAKQLLQGFAAMERLLVEDETRVKGYRVAGFSLPDVTYASDKRYETVVFDNTDKTRGGGQVSTSINVGVFAIMATPALLIFLLILWRR